MSARFLVMERPNPHPPGDGTWVPHRHVATFKAARDLCGNDENMRVVDTKQNDRVVFP